MTQTSLVVASLIGLILLAWIIQVLLYQDMKRINAPLWEELGSPGPWNTGWFQKFRKTRFIWSAEYTRFDDRRIRSKVFVLRAFDVVGWLVFAILALSAMGWIQLTDLMTRR